VPVKNQKLPQKPSRIDNPTFTQVDRGWTKAYVSSYRRTAELEYFRWRDTEHCVVRRPVGRVQPRRLRHSLAPLKPKYVIRLAAPKPRCYPRSDPPAAATLGENSWLETWETWSQKLH